MCAIADSFVAIHTSWADDADRWLCMLHYAALHATGVCTKDDIVCYVCFGAFNEEGVLHVACRMVFGKVH